MWRIPSMMATKVVPVEANNRVHSTTTPELYQVIDRKCRKPRQGRRIRFQQYLASVHVLPGALPIAKVSGKAAPSMTKVPAKSALKTPKTVTTPKHGHRKSLYGGLPAPSLDSASPASVSTAASSVESSMGPPKAAHAQKKLTLPGCCGALNVTPHPPNPRRRLTL